MKAYKGFDRDLKCHGFQYEIGKEYEEKDAKLREQGFHACENPLDVLRYYPPSGNRYCEVKLDEVSQEREDDSKVVGKKIRIETEIGLEGIISAGVKFIAKKAENNYKKVANTGNYSTATNTGYCSAATNTGKYSISTNTGYCSVSTNTGYCSVSTNTGNYSTATNTGYCSAATNTSYCSVSTNTGNCSVSTNTGNYSTATNTGYCSAATNTGNYSTATNTGDCSTATNTGDCSVSTNTGDCSVSTNTGDCSAASVTGKDSIAIVTGKASKAKGALGCWIVLTEHGIWNGETYPIKSVQAFYVDGDKVKADTFYKLKDGELVEVGDE